MIIVKLTQAGVSRVLSGAEGMTFMVDKVTQRYGTTEPENRIMHVRDYRYSNEAKALGRPWQIWTLAPGDYEIIEETSVPSHDITDLVDFQAAPGGPVQAFPKPVAPPFELSVLTALNALLRHAARGEPIPLSAIQATMLSVRIG